MPARHIATRFLGACIALLALGLGAAPEAGAEAARIALVIGNGNYADFGRLSNPVSDATDIAAALEALGFAVTLKTDANRKQMNQSLNDFHDRLAADSSSVGFFWYAGHGIQSKGENYLLPVGVQINREADLEDEAVSARKLMSLLDDARNKVNVVVLDACRNNPIPSMGRSGTRGLTVVSAAPAESLIMYSTGAGQIAQDGTGRNSPFAQSFLKYISQGGDITGTIKAVTAETKRLTGGAQVPYLYSSLTLDFAFNPKAAPAQAAAAPTMTILKSYGSLVVSAVTAGALYLDGAKLGDLPASSKASLNNIETGDRSLELRYADGHIEKQDATVAESQATSVSFEYKKAAPASAVKSQPNPWPTNGMPTNFVLVPGGSFTMGSPANEAGRDNDEVRHQVTLSSFAISKYDVTFDEYDTYCAATGAEKPSDNGWGRGARPVINVSWNEAVAYCNWRSKQEGRTPAYTISGSSVSCDWSANGYRLPTEAEWEYAAKGGDQANSLAVNAVYAGSENLDQVAWYSGNSGKQTHPVGQKAPNGLGLYDMAGNVWQWCWDWYGSSPTAIASDPTGASTGGGRVIRGGSWINGARNLRSATRNYSIPRYRSYNLGFRLACRP